MANQPQLVTLFGGSGFLGRYIARRMAKQGWRVRVAVRRPNEALFVKPYGAVGQVEPIFANIRDDASVTAALDGADAVVNCVGTFDRAGKNNFEAVQADGAERVARLAAAEGVKSLVHISAIGADSKGASLYARSKADGEARIAQAFKRSVILRPSIIFGTEDAFFNRFAAMANLLPVLPYTGGSALFQPVYVDDVAYAAEKAILGQVKAGIYELGGPDTESFADLMHRMQSITRNKKFHFNMPYPMAAVQASIFDFGEWASFGILKNTLITRDQLKQLQQDNVVSKGVKSFKDLLIEPTSMDAVLEDYLYTYRPYGQYTELTESGKHLNG